MKRTYLNYDFPLIIIDDFYNQTELDLIWEELNFLCYPHKMENNPGNDGNRSKDGQLIKKNSGLFLDDIYETNRKMSNILTCMRKVFDNNLEILENQKLLFFKFFPKDLIIKSLSDDGIFNIRDYTLVNYYENNNYYRPHHDESTITILNWFFKEPRSFDGGDLFFPSQDKKIELKNNRTVIFPSCVVHAVDQVKMSIENAGQKRGRFCITQFIHY